jgi:hypothetical protein
LVLNGIGLPSFANPFACWHGNLLNINRRKAILLTHNMTRYSLLIHGVTKKDLDTLDKIIVKRLKEQLMYDEFSIAQIEFILKHSESFSYFKSSERSVTGSMVEMAAISQMMIEREGSDPKIISSKLNDMFKKINGEYVIPKEKLKTMSDKEIA